MRVVCLSIGIAALFFTSGGGSKADLVTIPLNGQVQIVGPYSSDPTVPITVGLNVEFLASPLHPQTSQLEIQSFLLQISVSDPFDGFPLQYTACANTASPCPFQTGWSNFRAATHISSQFTTIGDSAVLIVTDDSQFSDPDPSPYFALQAILPEGLSIAVAAPVPEPSTWVMLLIGFAGVGFAGYRKSWRFSASVPAVGRG
jgi:PEP-CTERM motif